MVAGAELLDAIRRDPDDDGARAVYADWLSEHGDPRGEFITLQLERGRGTLAPKAARREAALLKKHVRRWLGTLAQVAQVAGGVSIGSQPSAGRARFDRGFLAECSLHGTPAQLQAIAGHPDLATVERLVLGGSVDVVSAILGGGMRALVAVTIGEHVDAVLASPVAARLEHLAMGSRGPQGFDAITATLPDRAPWLRAVRMSLHESIPEPPATGQRAFAAATLAAGTHPAMRLLELHAYGVDAALARADLAAGWQCELRVAHSDRLEELARMATALAPLTPALVHLVSDTVVVEQIEGLRAIVKRAMPRAIVVD